MVRVDGKLARIAVGKRELADANISAGYVSSFFRCAVDGVRASEPSFSYAVNVRFLL